MNTAANACDRKVRLVFFIETKARQELERHSAQSGAPVSELVRRSVAAWLDRQPLTARDGNRNECR